jgi:hypothetical protein
MYQELENWKQYKQKKKFNTNFMLVSRNLNDNSTKLVSEYDKKSFDKWMKNLIAKNGTTNY